MTGGETSIRVRVGGLIGSGSAVLFARLFSLSAAAVQLPLLTRLVSPGEYSSIAIAIAIATYFSLLTAEPIILGFQRFPGASQDRVNYTYALSRTLLAVGVAAALVVAVAFLFGRFEEAAAFAGWGIGIAVNRMISAAWLMWGRPWGYAWNLMAGTGVRTLVLLLMILAGCPPLLSLGAAGLASAVAAFIMSPKLRGTRVARKSRPWPFWFGIKLALASLAFTVLTNGSLLLLSVFVADDRVGKYAAMTQVAAMTSGAVIGLMLTVAYPRLRFAWDAGNRASVDAYLVSLQLGCLSIALISIFSLYVANHVLLAIIVPNQFVDGAVLAPLIMGTAFGGMGTIASWKRQFQFEAGPVARGTAVAAVVGLLTVLALASAFQERGAAIAAALGFLAYLLIMGAGSAFPGGIAAASIAALVLTSGGLVVPSTEAVAYPALASAVAILIVTARSLRARAI